MAKYALFETGTLADAVGRAARIAPTKGEGYDKAAGVLLQVEPTDDDMPQIIIKATDLSLYYMEYVNALEVGDEVAMWRLPSGLLAGILGNLPLGEGKTVRLTQEPNATRVHIKSGGTKANVSTITAGAFPRWERYDDSDMAIVPDLSVSLKQVAWACDKQTPPWSGVHIDGEYLIATDKVRIAEVPCEVPVDEPITVPLSNVAGVISPGAEVRMKAESHWLRLMPDDYTQISSVIFASAYPTRSQMATRLPSEWEYTTNIHREQLSEAIQRMTVLVKNERYPNLRMKFEQNRLEMYMEVDELGDMEEVIEEIDFEGSFEIILTPANLLDGLNAARGEIVELAMTHPYKPVRVTDSGGYVSHLMPKRIT